MRRIDVPFNLDLLQLTDEKIRGIRPVRSLGILDRGGAGLDDDGLFSTSIFGKPGDDRRMTSFSYIDGKASILHPIIFKTLVDARELHLQIMRGEAYAKFNEETGSFEKASVLDGETGYNFFIRHWLKIQLEANGSPRRTEAIKLLEKYKGRALNSKFVVMPAGMRDVEMVGGRPQMDEINDKYKKLLSIANSINAASLEHNPETMDRAVFLLQTTFYELYDHLAKTVQGKRKLMLGGWASRAIVNGTRNVITSASMSTPQVGLPDTPDYNSTIVGLYQQAKAALPVSIHGVRTGFLSKVFTGPSLPAILVNPKTRHSEEVHLKPQYFDRYMTDEGIEKLITSFQDENLRHKPLMIEGRYLGMVYLGPDATVRLIQDIRELPEGRSQEHVRWMTFVDLLYLSVYSGIKSLPGYLTRYPVAGTGSIYPSFAYMKTTVKGERRTELDDTWTPMPDRVCGEYPIHGDAFYNSLSPNPSRLAGLGADFDGDTASWNVVYSDEAIGEVKKYLSSKRAHVDTKNRATASIATATITYVMHNMMGD